jgi:hypothetical protein
MGFEVVHHGAHGGNVGREIGRAWVELGMQNSHRVFPITALWPSLGRLMPRHASDELQILPQ